MPRKQTTPQTSSITAKYMRKTNAALLEEITYVGDRINRRAAFALFRVLRKACASATAQDEKRGQK